MTRILLAAFLAFFPLIGHGAAGKPNIVLVLVDDLGWTDLGCYGSNYYQTPHIDKLAADGITFTHGYAACAVCSPTRAAVQTGRYPGRTYVTDWIRSRFQGGGSTEADRPPAFQDNAPANKEVICPRNPFWLESDEVTIAEMLKGEGYSTCYIGKWHLGPENWFPEKQGYDENFGGCDYGQPPSYYDPFNQPKGRHQTLRDGIHKLPGRNPGEYLTDREGDEAVGFIERNKDKPFFLMLGNYAVHTPIQPKKDLLEKYEAIDTKGPHKNAKYATMVESVDLAVGQIVETLEKNGLTENTIVIFTSDNGGLLGPTSNLPLRSGKGNPYEGGIRVPVIVKWPSVVKAGAVNDVPVTSVDFLPTLADASGVKSGSQEIDGVSLMPLLKGGQSLDRDAIFWHFPHYRGKIFPYSIVRHGDWKLLKRYAGEPKFELYNLAKDGSEETDLAEKEKAKVRELDIILSKHLAAINARIPKPNPNWKPKKG